jgi:hypothetical protein
LLPIRPKSAVPHLSVGWTPLTDAKALARHLGIRTLFLKDDGRNATGSMKDRASAVGAIKAREAQRKIIACASTGNAASSCAGIAASVALRSVIFVPERAPEPEGDPVIDLRRHRGARARQLRAGLPIVPAGLRKMGLVWTLAASPTGAKADLILVDYFPPTPLHRDNIPGHLLFGISNAPIDSLIVNGRYIVQNRECITVDERAVADKATHQARSLWRRFEDSCKR